MSQTCSIVGLYENTLKSTTRKKMHWQQPESSICRQASRGERCSGRHGWCTRSKDVYREHRQLNWFVRGTEVFLVLVLPTGPNEGRWAQRVFDNTASLVFGAGSKAWSGATRTRCRQYSSGTFHVQYVHTAYRLATRARPRGGVRAS